MRFLLHSGVSVAVLFLLAPLSTSAAIPEVAGRASSAMQDRDYHLAIRVIDQALAKEDDGIPADYLTYLKGRALHYQEDYDGAIAVFDGLARDFPDSKWARRVRLAKAVSFSRKNGFLEAEEIYRSEAEFLLSQDRKDEIANVYLEFAEQYFAPTDDQQKPNYEKALEFYNQALVVRPNDERQAYIDLRVGRCYQELARQDEAIKHFTAFINKYAAGTHIVEAKYQLGICQLQQGQHALARRTWQDLLRDHEDAQSPRIAEAAYKLALTHQLPTPPSPEDLSLGVAAARSFINKFPDHESASKAHLLIANSQQNAGHFADAAATLEVFLGDKRYANREEIPDARFQLGVCQQRQKLFDEALATWRAYLAQHPSHVHWTAAQQAIIDTEFVVAAEKQEDSKYDEARNLWNAFLVKYPLDPRAAQILFRLGQISVAEKKWDVAIEDWRRVVAKYPETDEASHAQLMIGLTLEEKLNKYEEAITAYKKLNWGSYQGKARQRLFLLTNKRMRIRTDRVFRTQDNPHVTLTSRNIETFTVRCYEIDLETYFRKMHLATGVESLDISLIDPDETFEFTVPEFAKYRETEHEIPLPAPGSAERHRGGVLVVTVSSDQLEATTMVLQSDLDIIVKSSRDELFVFAQNMRTGQAWPGARLLVSNGEKVVHEVTTGKDGVWQASLPELRGTDDVRVFAIDDQNTASNVVGLQGLEAAQGLTQKGYLYTDRPRYRPGQIVNIRGIVRSVADDTFRIDDGKTFDLTVFDPRNRPVWQQSVQLNDFGSFHSHYLLPAESALGDYRISISDNDKQSYQGTFSVSQYKLENIQLRVDVDRTVFYRGEKITGKILANFYYGAPLAGREIRYRLADDRVYTAKTDEKGELEFELPTDDFRATQLVPLVVELPAHSMTTVKQFVLATQGYALTVSTQRSVYLSGESFEATIKAVDAEGKPAARKLQLEVLEKTVVNGRTGERLVSKHEIETDQDDGTARLTLNLEEGGQFTLRATGIDRFDNPISGEHSVQVSGADDNTRLRLLANKHTFKVGDAPDPTIHWREEPALALITFQGARVLDHKLMTLNKGNNRLNVPMTADLAPNIEINVHVMRDAVPTRDATGKRVMPQRFHTASSHFQVMRDLVVEVTRAGDKPTATVRPGEPIEFRVKTTDPQGAPVAAEVSLAMVEQAMFDRFGTAGSPIGRFFHGVSRQISVRTTASISFAYQPKTAAIDANLLTEIRRRELESLEDESLLATDGLDDLFGDANGSSPVDTDTSAAPAATWDEMSRLSLESSQRQRLLVDRLSPSDTPLNVPQSQSEDLGAMYGGARFSDSGSRRDGGIARFGFSQQRGQEADLAGPQSGWGYQPRYRLGAAVRYYEIANAEQQDWSQVQRLAKNAASNSIASYAINGTLQHYNTVDFDGDGGEKLARELMDSGVALMPQLTWQETGYWNPAVRTDAEGTATVSFNMPDRTTAWKLLARGITHSTLAGEGDAEIVARKVLSGELKLPMAFTDGDKTTLIATVHNHEIKHGQITVTLESTIGTITSRQTKTLDAAAAHKSGVQDVEFPIELNRPDDSAEQANVEATFELIVESGKASDRFRRSIPVEPYGISVFGGASGIASGDTATWVQLPDDIAARPASLQIVVGPSIERGMLDILFGPTLRCDLHVGGLASPSDTAASDLMAAVGLQQLLSKSKAADHPQTVNIDQQIRATVSLLVASQNDDGGWGWAKAGHSNRNASARTVWALSNAVGAGYVVATDSMDKARQYLESQLGTTSQTDHESKAVLLHALTTVNQDDFALANRLYRSRPSLSTASLLHLAMALAEMDRQPLAAEVLDVVATRNLDDDAPRRTNARSTSPWNHSPTELRALFAVALQQVRPADGRIKELTQWLMQHRIGNRWSPDKATGPATVALCQWHARNQFVNEHYKLAVFVNDQRIEDLDITDLNRTVKLDVPQNLLKDKGRQRIHFEMTGRGQFSYQCVLEGFAQADSLKSTTNDWRVSRFYEAAPLERDGKTIPRGFDVLNGSYRSFRNAITELPVGRRGHVELRVYRDGVSSETPEEHLEYLVVTEPLPSGVTVINDSVRGGFERFEIRPGAITFFIGNRRSIGRISFDVHGYLPGSYRAAPAVVRDAYRPDQFAVSKSAKLDVLPSGQESKDAYRLTPRELFELGKRHFERQEYDQAAQQLDEIVSKWRLKPDVLRDCTQMLLDTRLEIGPPAQVVQHFEVIKEKWPDLEVSYDKILRIGAAYHDMGEYERCYLIFRATVESSFLSESRVAGFLQAQGEPIRSVEYMNDLLTEYPPEPYVAAATFDLAQQVYALAPNAATNKQLRQRKINRVDLIRRSAGMLGSFLTAYPQDPAADRAGFSLATALLELEQYQPTINACRKFISRYPDSDDLDSFWYTIGYCHFALGQHDEALDVCRKVSEMKRKDKQTGRLVPSENHYRAIYILGQIYHSLGKASQAVDQYRRVESQFSDAGEAIRYFTRRDIKLPEVTTFLPQLAANDGGADNANEVGSVASGPAPEVAEEEKVSFVLPLAFRNVAECVVKVYRIDLMKFGLLERNLGGIRDINLAGIKPYHEKTLKLGDGNDYRDRSLDVKLPLAEEGAYLVVCRGGDLHTSGMVLVSPLAIEVQEEASSGRVRTTIKQKADNRYSSDIDVKVIGSLNDSFISGKTDLRGVFIADNIRGNSTVIAQADNGQYAFYRGDRPLGPPPEEKAGEKQDEPAAAEKPAGQQKAKSELLKGLMLRNSGIQEDNYKRQREQYFNEESGVRAEAVK